MPPRIFDKVALSIRSKMRVALGVNSSSPISGRQQDSKAGIDRGMHLWGGNHHALFLDQYPFSRVPWGH